MGTGSALAPAGRDLTGLDGLSEAQTGQSL